MKTAKPIKHLPKRLRMLYKDFKRHTEPQIKSFLIEEMRYLGFNDFADEIELNELQKQLKLKS